MRRQTRSQTARAARSQAGAARQPAGATLTRGTAAAGNDNTAATGAPPAVDATAATNAPVDGATHGTSPPVGPYAMPGFWAPVSPASRVAVQAATAPVPRHRLLSMIDKIPLYEPSATLSAETWIGAARRTLHLMKQLDSSSQLWDDLLLFNLVGQRMGPSALAWFNYIESITPDNLKTPDLLFEELRRRFGRRMPGVRVRKIMATYYWALGETYQKFAGRLRHLTEGTNIPDDELMQYFIDGIDHTTMGTVKGREPQSLAEAARVATKQGIEEQNVAMGMQVFRGLQPGLDNLAAAATLAPALGVWPATVPYALMPGAAPVAPTAVPAVTTGVTKTGQSAQAGTQALVPTGTNSNMQMTSSAMFGYGAAMANPLLAGPFAWVQQYQALPSDGAAHASGFVEGVAGGTGSNPQRQGKRARALVAQKANDGNGQPTQKRPRCNGNEPQSQMLQQQQPGQQSNTWQPRSTNGGRFQCYACKQEGHMARNCPDEKARVANEKLAARRKAMQDQGNDPRPW